MEHTISKIIAWTILLIVTGAPILSGILQVIREEAPVDLEPDIDDDIEEEE